MCLLSKSRGRMFFPAVCSCLIFIMTCTDDWLCFSQKKRVERKGVNLVPEHAGPEEAFDQSIEDESLEGSSNSKASPGIVIDPTPRPLQIVQLEATENEPALWTVRKTHCPVKGCPSNMRESITAAYLPEHVETMHKMSRHDSSLGLYAKLDCPFPGCKSKVQAVTFDIHVRR